MNWISFLNEHGSQLVGNTILLLLVLDPFGNTAICVPLLKRVPAERQKTVILRECLIAYVVMMLFLLCGQWLLKWLHLSSTSMGIAGGVVLFLVSLKMIFGGMEELFGENLEGEPFIVPIAIPSIAGPSALATMILLTMQSPHDLVLIGLSMTLAMVLTGSILLLGPLLLKKLGNRVVIAFERLMGLILAALAIEMLLSGVQEFVLHLRSLG